MSEKAGRIENRRTGRRGRLRHLAGYGLLLLMLAAVLWGCGKAGEASQSEAEKESGAESAEAAEGGTEADGAGTEAGEEPGTGPNTGLARETAGDADVDFAVLQKENPDIFAWLLIPGTGIDDPILQSAEADDYYESHNAYGEPDEKGALYTELANLKSMCDFNTVIHGKSGEEGLFEDLYQFADPDFFDAHEEVYLYLDGNLLTYTVFAAYERENTSLIRSYDFTYGTGCEKFLADMYGSREMGKNVREGWEDVTPYHFLITLTTQREEQAEKQFVVLAALVGDAAGTIDRTVEW